MSKILATITNIQNKDNLHIVKFDYFGVELQMLSLELNSNIKIASKVILSIKSTNVGISKNFKGKISYQNQIKATIQKLTNGALLSVVILKLENTTIESIITLEMSRKMNLKINDEVTIFINGSDLSIFKVIYDD